MFFEKEKKILAYTIILVRLVYCILALTHCLHFITATYTYLMRVPLERQGVDQIHYTDSLADRTSPSHQQLTEAAREGLDRMVMQSNLRDIYHDIVVSGFEPTKESDRAAVVYVVRVCTYLRVP